MRPEPCGFLLNSLRKTSSHTAPGQKDSNHVKAIEVKEFIKENITVQYVIFLLQIQETDSLIRTGPMIGVLQTRLDSPVTLHSVFEPENPEVC